MPFGPASPDPRPNRAGSPSAAQYASARSDVFDLLTDTAGPYLDVGCSSGLLGERIRAAGLGHVTGIEFDPERAALAANRLDEVLVGDATEVLERFSSEGRTFGTLVLADVLEHVADPWAAYAAATSATRAGGHLIVSLPNVGHVSVVLGLLRGRFPYRDRGILDRTHLRFFGLRDIHRFVTSGGLCIDDVSYQYRFLDRNSRINRSARLVGPVWKRGLAYQVVVRVRVPHG